MAVNAPNSIMTSRRYLLAWVYFFAAFATVLCVPYLVPQQPSNSSSWLFGYNNRAAVVLIVLFAIVGARWTHGAYLKLHTGQSQRMPLWPLWASLGYAAYVCITAYRAHGHAGGYSESAYSIQRVWLMTLGKRPYIDFEWPFGVAQIYIPYALHQAFGIGIEPAVYLYWGVAVVTGIVLLYLAVRIIDYPSHHNAAIYCIVFALSAVGLNGMGAQYTPLRYSAPMFCIVAGYNTARKLQARNAWVRWIISMWFAAFLLFLISPEVALAFIVGCVLLTVPRKSEDWLQITVPLYALLCLGFAALCIIAARCHEFDTLRSSGGGAESLPIVFSLATFIVMLQIALCSGAAYKFWTRQQPLDNTLALIALNVFLLPAAFGRADLGHLVLKTLPLTLATLFYLSGSGNSWRSLGVTCLAALYVLPPVFDLAIPLAHKLRVHGQSSTAASDTNRAADGYPAFHVPGTPVPDQIDFASVYPGIDFSGAKATLAAPFGYMPRGWPVFYLSTQIDYGFYKGVENANSVAAIERRIAELQAHPDRNLLVAQGSTNCKYFDVRAERGWIETLNQTVYLGKPKHLERPLWPLCQYIQEHYTMAIPASAENWNYELWTPKN